MDKGFIHKIAVVCKDYYVNRTIDDLFIFNGADRSWWTPPSTPASSERMNNVYGWIEGIQANSPSALERIVIGVATQLIEDNHISESDTKFLQRYLASTTTTAPPPTNATTELNTMSMEDEFTLDPEPLLATLVRLLAGEGLAREVAILAHAEAKIIQSGYENWNGGIYLFTLHLQVPTWLYAQIKDYLHSIEEKILDSIRPLMQTYEHDAIEKVSIIPMLTVDKEWRDKAKAWLAGSGVTNQGRVRSDNVAPRTCDGLLFRSQPEILLYKAFKAQGVSFAPLPVFVRGGEKYRRIEPDFVVLKDGIVMIIEVDGDTVHQETPAEAHTRTTMLVHEGAHVERVKASECDTEASAATCAKRLLQVISKLKATR